LISCLSKFILFVRGLVGPSLLVILRLVDLGDGDMGIAAYPFPISHNMGANMDAMNRHHAIRKRAFHLLDAVGAPIAVVAIVDVCADKLLRRESRSAGHAVDAFGDEVAHAFALR
jgi:hypothetical protein